MLVKKYVVIFSVLNEDIYVLLEDGHIPSIELDNKTNLYNYKQIIENIYFGQETLVLEHCMLHQDKTELALVDFCVMFKKVPFKGEWINIKEVLNNNELDKKTLDFVYRASRKV